MIQNSAPDYHWYLQRKIEQYTLQNNIVFLGYLDAEEIKHYLLNVNIFVSASSTEHIATTLGEAMMLGVPCVASCVGAMQEMIDHGRDGFLYPFNETYMLADYICQLFESPPLAEQFSKEGHLHAARTYDRDTNCRKLLEMYETIAQS